MPYLHSEPAPEKGHGSPTLRIAVAAKGQNTINEHFGHAREFHIYDVSLDGCKFVGARRVVPYCQGGYGEDEVLGTVIQTIIDCSAVFAVRIGNCPQKTLAVHGIEPVERFAYEFIDQAILTYYREKVVRGDT